MKRKEEVPLNKVCLNLYEGDFQRLQSLHPDIGAGKVIRVLVHSYLKNITDKTIRRLNSESEEAA
jgi:hypothetical protein